MTRAELLRIIRKLPASTPIADQIAPPSQYESHKDHWCQWLEEYNGPGYYGRSNHHRDARFIWYRCQNIGMLIWLGEAVGRPVAKANHAATFGLERKDRLATVCAAVRDRLYWPEVMAALERA